MSPDRGRSSHLFRFEPGFIGPRRPRKAAAPPREDFTVAGSARNAAVNYEEGTSAAEGFEETARTRISPL
jgi:hypothetical protein